MTTTEARKIWLQVLSALEQRISQAHFRTWLAHSILSSEDGNFRIGVVNNYAKGVILKHYLPLIIELLSDICGEEAKVEIVVESSLGSKQGQSKETPFFTLNEAPVPQKKTSLGKAFTFANFAVSTSNQLAHAAAVAAAKMPGKAYNPLFIYGGVGVGKTHLMQAIGHTILEQHLKTSILYCTGEEFTNELIGAIQTKTTNSFKRKYRELECLLIDDIQFIAGKTSVQEEFFHTFNAIHRNGGQIVLTSDRQPSEIDRMEERLVSRFEAGMIVDVSPPDFELKTAILLIKAKYLGISLPMQVAHLIAEKAQDIRRMEGMLTRFMAISTVEQEPFSEELVARLFGKSPQPAVKIIQPLVVVEQVAAHYNLKVYQLKGAKRNRVIVRPRQVAMYLLREDLRLPLTEVGRFLGGRDHSTILHGVEKVTQLLVDDQDLSLDIAGIRKAVWG